MPGEADDEGEPSMADNQETEIPDGVAYATLLFLVFISKHNLPFRYCAILCYVLCVACKCIEMMNHRNISVIPHLFV